MSTPNLGNSDSIRLSLGQQDVVIMADENMNHVKGKIRDLVSGNEFHVKLEKLEPVVQFFSEKFNINLLQLLCASMNESLRKNLGEMLKSLEETDEITFNTFLNKNLININGSISNSGMGFFTDTKEGLIQKMNDFAWFGNPRIERFMEILEDIGWNFIPDKNEK